jgi:hypothetical protein
VVEGPSGLSYGETKTFTVPPLPPTPPPPARLPDPKAGSTANVDAHGRAVGIELPGTETFVALTDKAQIPIGAGVDATKAPITLTTAASTTGAQVAQADVSGGRFDLLQAAAGTPVTQLALEGGNFAACPSPKKKKAKASRLPAAGKVRNVRIKGTGPYRIRGRYAAASVRGTEFTVTDRCDGTLTKVISGRVAVRDLVKHRTIVLKAGRSYLAKPKRR